MKKETIVKNVLLSSLLGFPIGISLLIVAYICVYFIEGITIYQTEINRLLEIKTLILQTVLSGLSYYIVSVLFHTMLQLNNLQSKSKYMSNHPYKSVSILLLTFLGLMIAISIFNINEIFYVNISIMSTIILVILFALSILFFIIKTTYEFIVIKIINKTIKERNN